MKLEIGSSIETDFRRITRLPDVATYLKGDLYCCGCQKEIIPRLVDSFEIYPHRKDLYKLPFWKCDNCGNYVGCHHKTEERTRPLGCIPTPEIREARMKVHSVLDPLWQEGFMTRASLYKYLSSVLGRVYHTADLRSIDEVDLIIKALKVIKLAKSTGLNPPE